MHLMYVDTHTQQFVVLSTSIKPMKRSCNRDKDSSIVMVQSQRPAHALGGIYCMGIYD